MSYRSRQDRYFASAKPYKAPALSTFKRHPLLGAQKVRTVYDAVHGAWRAGAVEDFSYGARSFTDPTVVWTVDGTEFAKSELAGVQSAVAAALVKAGIVSVAFGASWCGYQSLTVEYVDGSVTVDSYDGQSVVVAEELAVAA